MMGGTQLWQERHLRLAVEAACVALWAWHVEDDLLRMDERGFQLWGIPWSGHVTFEELSASIHPADRDRVRAAFSATRSVAGSYEIDFRIIVGDEVRWVSARGQGADVGMVDGSMFGIFLDVTGRKQAEEGSELLAGEMSHRVKNLLSIATGLTQLTGRSALSVDQMTRALTERLTALGRAHDVVRPLPGQQGKAALLGRPTVRPSGSLRRDGSLFGAHPRGGSPHGHRRTDRLDLRNDCARACHQFCQIRSLVIAARVARPL